MSDSLQPPGVSQSSWTPLTGCLWDSPGKDSGVGYRALLQGNLPDPGMEPTSLMSPTLEGGLFNTSAAWEAHNINIKP